MLLLFNFLIDKNNILHTGTFTYSLWIIDKMIQMYVDVYINNQICLLSCFFWTMEEATIANKFTQLAIIARNIFSEMMH